MSRKQDPYDWELLWEIVSDKLWWPFYIIMAIWFHSLLVTALWPLEEMR